MAEIDENLAKDSLMTGSSTTKQIWTKFPDIPKKSEYFLVWITARKEGSSDVHIALQRPLTFWTSPMEPWQSFEPCISIRMKKGDRLVALNKTFDFKKEFYR